MLSYGGATGNATLLLVNDGRGGGGGQGRRWRTGTMVNANVNLRSSRKWKYLTESLIFIRFSTLYQYQYSLTKNTKE